MLVLQNHTNISEPIRLQALQQPEPMAGGHLPNLFDPCPPQLPPARYYLLPSWADPSAGQAINICIE